jgi:ATP-dependent Clp endopeptidase proteolytic subunit ClpP
MKIIYKKHPLIQKYEIHKEPIIVRVNKFDEASAKDFSDKMGKAHSTGQPVIPIVIDSYGGQVYSLMSMISDIKHASIPVATIVQGKAMSCGAILFSFGAKDMRFMDPDATVMIHDVSSGAWGKIEEIKADAAEAERLNQKVYRMMAKNCGKRADYFLKCIHEKGHADWYLDGEECLKHNLATELRVPEFVFSVNVDFNFE